MREGGRIEREGEVGGKESEKKAERERERGGGKRMYVLWEIAKQK